MSLQSEKVKNWRKRTKERIAASLGGKCVVCDYDRCTDSLDCHHVDPTEKESGISKFKTNPAQWSKIVEELRKCVLLCRNCHGELHAGVTSIPTDAARFDESFATYKLLPGATHPCPTCQTETPDIQRFCSNVCSGKFKRPMKGNPGRPKKLAGM